MSRAGKFKPFRPSFGIGVSHVGNAARGRHSAFGILLSFFLLPSSFCLAADNFTVSGNYNYTLNSATETKTWNIVQTPTNQPFTKGVTSVGTNGAAVNFGDVTTPWYGYFRILTTNTAYWLKIGVIENSTTNYLAQLYGNSSGGEFAQCPLASTSLFALPNTNGVFYERFINSR